MSELTPQQRDVLLANSRQNRAKFPPVAMTGIGQFPLALVPSVFGGIALEGPAPNQFIGTLPEKITGFDKVIPDFATSGVHPEGLLPDPDTDQLQVLKGGIYLVNIRINAIVTTGAAYRIEVFANDNPTGIFTAQDLSNQTGFLSVVLIASGSLEDDDVVSVYVSSDGVGRTFTMQDSSFFLSMIR